MANVLDVASVCLAISVGFSNIQRGNCQLCPLNFNLGDPCLIHCYNGLSCGGNTICTTTRFVCQCASTHYDDTGTADIGGSCKQKITVGMSCPKQSTGVLPTDSCSDPHATCVKSSAGLFTCQCNDGYHNNDGNCIQQVDVDQTCRYSSTSGAILKYECSDPNASCRLSSGQYTCQCYAGYYNNGGICTLQRDLEEACTHVSQCNDSNAICSGTCQCASTHYDNIGGSCVKKVGVDKQCTYSLTKYVCSDPNASCRLSSGQYMCQCYDGYYNNGGTCTSNICECANRGKCIDGRCYCHVGYFGEHCESQFCSATSCLNGGLCIRNSSQQRCVCESGYFGDRCQNSTHGITDNFLKKCDNTCNNHGQCIDFGLDQRCFCNSGYSGINCNQSIADIQGPSLGDGSADQSSDTQNQFTASDLAAAAGSAFAAAVVLCLIVVYVCRLRTHKKLCFRDKESPSIDKLESASKSVQMKKQKQHQRHEVLYENSGCDTMESAITTTTDVNDGLTVPTSIYETIQPENGNTDHVYTGIVTSDKSGSGGITDHRKPAIVKSDDNIAMTDHVYLNLKQGSNIS